MTVASGETWHYDNDDHQGSFTPGSFSVTYAREFRYDGPRQRYLNAELDLDDLMLPTPLFTHVSPVCSIYDGDTIYGDCTYETSGDLHSYEPGMGTFAWSGGPSESGKAWQTWRPDGLTGPPRSL